MGDENLRFSSHLFPDVALTISGFFATLYSGSAPSMTFESGIHTAVLERSKTTSSASQGTTTVGRTLDRLTAHARDVQGVRREDLQAGDWIVVYTRNSVYTLAVIGNGRFQVSGGWFAREGCACHAVGVAGCTWGGHALLTAMVAAPGMCLEFDNGVRTTRIREVRTMRGEAGRGPH